MRDELPALLPLPLVNDVVLRAFFRIDEDVIRVGDRAKAAVVAGFEVVGMESRRQKPVDTMNRVRLGIGADLKRLVMVAVGCRFHWYPPSNDDSGTQGLSAREEEKQREHRFRTGNIV